jgi:hypothetical protein
MTSHESNNCKKARPLKVRLQFPRAQSNIRKTHRGGSRWLVSLVSYYTPSGFAVLMAENMGGSWSRVQTIK